MGTFREIAAIEPPTEFTTLWASDVAAHDLSLSGVTHESHEPVRQDRRSPPGSPQGRLPLPSPNRRRWPGTRPGRSRTRPGRDRQDAGRPPARRRAVPQTSRPEATVDQKPKLEKEREQIDKQIGQASDALSAAEKKYKETTDPLLGQRDYIRDQLLEIDRAKTELERTCDDQDLLGELAKAERQLNVLHTCRKETEFAIKQREARAFELKDTSFRLSKNPEGTTRDEAETRKQIEDLRDRADYLKKEVGELEKTLAAVRSEIDATEKAAVHQRDRLLIP